ENRRESLDRAFRLAGTRPPQPVSLREIEVQPQFRCWRTGPHSVTGRSIARCHQNRTSFSRVCFEFGVGDPGVRSDLPGNYPQVVQQYYIGPTAGLLVVIRLESRQLTELAIERKHRPGAGPADQYADGEGG